jgi:hypothetical protein
MYQKLPKLSLFLALFWLPFFAKAQVAIPLVTYEDVPVTYGTVSLLKPDLAVAPSNGEITWEEDPVSFWTLTYTPDPGFLGQDFFRILNYPVSGGFSILQFTVTVTEAEIIANHDYVYLASGNPIAIDVLANDYSSTGVKQINAIPVVNGGSATIDNDQISFTPAPGFRGLADLNYVVCNEIGTCAVGTVSIGVKGSGTVATADTLRIYPKREAEQLIFVPDDYTLVAPGPLHGTYDPTTDIPTYTPDPDYVGPDELIFSDGSDRELVFQVEVLDLEEQQFTDDDQFYTLVGRPLTVNVLADDLYGSLAGCFGYTEQSEKGGTISAVAGSANGTISYTPPPGFQGVDQFRYRAFPPLCNGEAEWATVYVIVSNFEPGASRFELKARKATPQVINYDIPAPNFSFSLGSNTPDLGEVIFLSGTVDTVIQNTVVRGENLLLYVPDANVASGSDEFEITYCLQDGATGNADCLLSKTVKVSVEIQDIAVETAPLCATDCVWPGDANEDGRVDLADLLTIGRYIGALGPTRESAGAGWFGQVAGDWGTVPAAADANGDGIVSAADTAVVLAHLDEAHTLQSYDLSFAPFEVNLVAQDPMALINMEPGDYIVFDVVLGTDEEPAEDVYGFTLPFAYDNNFFKEESIEFFFEDADCWASYDSPILALQRNNLQDFAEMAYTRTSGNPISGKGTVAQLTIGVEDVIPTREGWDSPAEVTIGGGVATVINSSGDRNAVRINPVTLLINPPSKEDDVVQPATATAAYLDGKLLAYPNPTRDRLTVHLNGQLEFEQLIVSDMSGRELIRQSGLQTNHRELSLAQLPDGIYTLTVITADGVVNRLIKVAH